MPNSRRHRLNALPIFDPARFLRSSRFMLSAGVASSALGAVSAVRVPAQITTIDLSRLEIDGAGFKIEGAVDDDQAGRGVSGAGDVNGDGLADLIIGAPQARIPGEASGGESYVVFGKRSSTPVLTATLVADSAGFIVQGADGGDRSGSAVAGLGDVNGDGLDDVLIGSFYADPNGVANAGEAYVVFGRRQGESISLLPLGEPGNTDGYRLQGFGFTHQAGDSVSGAGDLNRDGVPDMIVGAPGAFNNGAAEDAGEAYAVFGKSDTTTIGLAGLGSGGGFRIQGIDPFDRAGTNVSGVGDLNGDGRADLLIGMSESNVGGVPYTGEAYVVFGKDDNALVNLATLEIDGNGFLLDGIDNADAAGLSVAGAGDVNGDGRGDLIIGAHRADRGDELGVGEAYVVFGKADTTPVAVADLATNGQGFVIEGVAERDFAGRRVAGAGDVNGDGLSDVLVGAHSAARGEGTSQGEAYLVFGKADTAPIALASLGTAGVLFRGLEQGDRLGIGVSAAGDVSGDGLADIILGADEFSISGGEDAGEAYVVFSPFAMPPDAAIYRAVVPTGGGRTPIGVAGNSSMASSPDSRCFVDFDGGAGAVLVEVELRRRNTGVANLADPLDVLWRVAASGDADWTSAVVTLRLIDADLVAPGVFLVSPFRADAPEGPWTPITNDVTLDTSRGLVSFRVNSLPAYLAFAQGDIPDALRLH